MDFSHLPETAFLQIFEYLTLEDCIRVRLVNKSFCGIAHLTISRINDLDLTEDRFRNLTGDQLVVILDLCSSNLERIKFPSNDDKVYPSETETKDWDDEAWNDWNEQNDRDNQGEQLATIFSNYQCHRLTNIDLGSLQIDDVVFEQLIQNNPILEYLSSTFPIFPEFPNITVNTLKGLYLNVDQESVLQTLIGRFPNLGKLHMNSGNFDIPANIWDQFFGSIPQAKRICIHMLESSEENVLKFEELVNFWNLPLTSLDINFLPDDRPGDNFLYKIATSFPHMQELRLVTITPTSAGIASLSVLQELEMLELNLVADENGHDEGIRQLAHCRNLQCLVLPISNITGGTFVNLLRSCPQLERVEIWEITQVDSPEEAAVILESLAGLSPGDITIKFHSDNAAILKPIWEAELTKAAIKKLEETDGLYIKIDWREL